MIPIWLRYLWKHVWIILTFKYSLVLCLCLWALWIQLSYRVASRFLFVIIPWIGVALSVLSFIFLANHFLVRASSDNVFRQIFRQFELWAIRLIWVFVCYSAFIYANGVLDRSVPLSQPSQVLSISNEKIDVGFRLPYSWANLQSWEQPGQTERVLLRFWEEDQLWAGEDVRIQIRQGYFGLPWVMKIERDEEKYNQQVLKLAPTASQAWKGLWTFYMNHHRWEEVATTAQGYLKIYPNDYAFATTVGGLLIQAGHFNEGNKFLEYVLTRKPTYDAYQLFGYTLREQGNNTRAAQILETSIPLDPDDWQAYYQLGYVYSELGEYRKAVPMFEKALERKPHFPEVQAQLTGLRQKIATPISKR